MAHAAPTRRALLATPALLLAPGARAQGFPERPIRLLVPWPPGASADVFLRTIADQAGKRLGQPVIPENRPGANGTLGAAALRDARPDGYTLAQLHGGVHRTMVAAERPTYDSLRDFQPIIRLSGSAHGLVCHAESPWRSLAEVIAAARARPGQITYGTLGPISVQHLAMLEIAQRAGVEFSHIPYRGGGELYTGLMSRAVDLVADASGWVPMVDDGRFRLLVTFGAERMPRYAEVPNLKDAGIDLVVDSPYGIGGPRGMDPAVVKRLHDGFREALEDPVTRATMVRFNMPYLYEDTAGFEVSWRALYEQERAGVVRAGLAMR